MSARTDFVREDGLVIKSSLHPVHKRVDVVWGGEFGRSLIGDAILPEVLVSRSDLAHKIL